MTLAHLWERLLRDDVQLGVDGDRLTYDAPQESMTNDLLELLRSNKSTLIDWLIATDPRGRVERRCLPAFNQRELWNKDRTAGAPVVYTVAQRWHIRGGFDHSAFVTAVNLWLSRHPALRSRFTDTGDGQPLLEICKPWLMRVPSTGSKHLDTEIDQLVNQPIRMDQAPLWRIRLWRLNEQETVLAWVIHHSICDGTSMRELRDDLVSCYDAVRARREPPTIPPGPGPVEYARAQQATMSGPARDRLTDWWKTHLADASFDLPFQADRPRPDTLSGRGAIVEFTLPEDTLTHLRDVARRHGTTLYLVMLSAYATMLSEFTGQPEVVLPISQARRTDPEFANVVGMLSDRVPVRISVGTASDFGDLVDQVGGRVFEAIDRELPLSLLLERLPAAQRPTGSYPTALFTLLDGFETPPRSEELTIDVESAAPTGTARMEFYCFMTTCTTGLRGWLEYSSDRFDAATVEHWIGRFIEILTAVR